MSNLNNWLNFLSWAEGTLRPEGRGYDIQFGGGKFDYTRPGHPDQVIPGGKVNSAAAGAYQFMPGTWQGLVDRYLGEGDMSPERQDQAAIILGRQRGVDFTKDPITKETIAKLAPEWASLPTVNNESFYPNQSVKTHEEIDEYLKGTLAQGASTPPTAPPPVPPEEKQDDSLLELIQRFNPLEILKGLTNRDESSAAPRQREVVYEDDPATARALEKLKSDQGEVLDVIAALKPGNEVQRVGAGMQQQINAIRNAFGDVKSVI